MNKLIAILCCILILIPLSFSQVKDSNNYVYSQSWWNISFSAGPVYTLIDEVQTDNKFYPGYNAGFEMFYNLDNKSALVFSFSFTRQNSHGFENKFYTNTGFSEKKELFFGPRFYLGKNYFVDAAIGNYFSGYSFHRTYKIDPDFGIGNYEQVYAGMGGSIGGGKTFSLSENVDLFVKGKISFGLPNLEAILNTGINAGIIFNNRKIEKNTEKEIEDRNIWIFSVVGGVISPEFFHTNSYDLTPKFGIEAALRKSSRVEAFCSLNYNKLSEKYSSDVNRNIIDLTFGPRFLFGSKNYIASAEIAAGIYIYDINKDSYNTPDAIYMGANFGPGIIITITKYVSFIAKSNMHFVFNHLKKPGGFLTASGGIRYEL